MADLDHIFQQFPCRHSLSTLSQNDDLFQLVGGGNCHTEPANEENLPEIAEEIREDLDGFLRKSCQKTREQIVEERYERFRRM